MPNLNEQSRRYGIYCALFRYWCYTHDICGSDFCYVKDERRVKLGFRAKDVCNAELNCKGCIVHNPGTGTGQFEDCALAGSDTDNGPLRDMPSAYPC